MWVPRFLKVFILFGSGSLFIPLHVLGMKLQREKKSEGLAFIIISVQKNATLFDILNYPLLKLPEEIYFH